MPTCRVHDRPDTSTERLYGKLREMALARLDCEDCAMEEAGAELAKVDKAALAAIPSRDVLRWYFQQGYYA